MKKNFLKWMSLQLIMLLMVCFAASTAWAEGTEQQTTLAQGNPEEITASANPVTCSYQTHIQDVGWQEWKSNGLSSGTSGESKRLEGIRIELDSQGYDLNVAYQTHIQNIGWEAEVGRGWKSSGDMSGTQGLSYRLEGIQIKLTGSDSGKFDIYYRVHAQNFGWLGWARNGESAGTAGYGYRLEAIQIKVVSSGSAAPGSTVEPFKDADPTTSPDPVVDPPVVDPPADTSVAVTGVNLNKNVINMAVGENVGNLVASVVPDNATNKNVSYSSGNQTVVQVDNSGKVQALAAGKAVITVTTADGNKQVNCEVIVHQDKATLADGIYTIKKLGTNNLVDVTGARTANGTNVTVYQASNTSNQQWRLENSSNGTIRLWAVCAPDKVLDVLRSANAIKVFNTIDIWEANDPDCQYWYLTKLYNGAYAIRLNSNESLAVSNNGRDADVYAGPFDATGTDVMWTFEAVAAPAPDPKPVERAAWIHNTGSVGNVNVRSGPGTQNPSIGGFNEGTQITVIGDLNGEWYQVRGTDRITGGQVSGYTHKDYVRFDQVTPPAPEPFSPCWPVEGTYKYAYALDYYYAGSPHAGGQYGVDIVTDVWTGGGRKILAVESGVVESISADGNPNSGWGKSMIIRHNNGYYSRYSHLVWGSNTVSEGQSVAKGQHIATMGSTGNSTGVHLDFRLMHGSSSNQVDAFSMFINNDSIRPLIRIDSDSVIPASIYYNQIVNTYHFKKTGNVYVAP